MSKHRYSRTIGQNGCNETPLRNVSAKSILGKGYGGLTKPQQWRKEENERLRGEGDQNLDLNEGKLQDLGKEEDGKKLYKLYVLWIDASF